MSTDRRQRIGKTARRVACFALGHSRNFYLQLFLAKKDGSCSATVLCARCGGSVQHRLKGAGLTYTYKPLPVTKRGRR